MMVKPMKTFALPQLSLRLRRSVARFLRENRGMAAIEFAFIVPLMLVMFFGMIEISNGVAADRKVSMVAQSISDLTSRSRQVVDTDLSNFFVIADAMMTPFSPTPLKATITEIYIDPATGVARAQWSKGDVPRAQSMTVPVPANLISRDPVTNKILPNQYLIFSEVSYNYKPAVGYVMSTNGVTLSDQTYTRPRQSNCVLYNPVTSTDPCPTK
jgi:Flp pilus assembly protein TadG